MTGALPSAHATVEERLEALGFHVPESAPPAARYRAVVCHDNLAFVSGQLPRQGDRVLFQGKVGRDLSVAEAGRAAELCVLRALAALREALGDLGHIDRVIRLMVYVASADDFTSQSEVADGASDLIRAAFGDIAGAHARTSIGVAALPKNAAVEIDLVAALSSSPTAGARHDP